MPAACGAGSGWMSPPPLGPRVPRGSAEAAASPGGEGAARPLSGQRLLGLAARRSRRRSIAMARVSGARRG